MIYETLCEVGDFGLAVVIKFEVVHPHIRGNTSTSVLVYNMADAVVIILARSRQHRIKVGERICACEGCHSSAIV